MHVLRHFVTRDRRERSRIERADAALEGLVTAVERANDGRTSSGETCLFLFLSLSLSLTFLSRTNPRLHTGVLQRSLREGLLAHQREREARGVQVPARQVAAKRFHCQSGTALLRLLFLNNLFIYPTSYFTVIDYCRRFCLPLKIKIKVKLLTGSLEQFQFQ